MTQPAYSKEQAHEQIRKLVEDFEKIESHLENTPEAQIENDYIRPLFRCLNWNVANVGLSHDQREFVLQQTDRHHKRPDYLLHLNGQDVLLMDAKRVKHDMHDPRWLNQVYAYAYSTQKNPLPRKVDFAILTDFQEFVVLDCTMRATHPGPKALLNFRVLDWRYSDYLAEFDTLWELFERSNLLAASADRKRGLWARLLSPKQVKANRIPPDEAFLDDLDNDRTGWRVRLAKDMKRCNPNLDGDVITAAVQLLIDRLVFVKALSDREIEEDCLAELAQTVEKDGLADNDRGWFAACKDVFAKLNKTYNGSVFSPRPELEAVEVSNQTIREIIRDFQPEHSPYNLAVLPVEILGQIYERFLGRVIRTTDQRVKVEDKPEVRKAGGVYYTPRYIVDYIVQNTLGKLLTDCKTPADVARLKILDPACGSGSFLLGAYEALIDWHKRYYGGKDQLSRKDREVAYYDPDGSIRLTAKLKRQILLNNIFGVDIDQQAVEVTRFSLSLKSLEDTRRDELYEEVNLFKQTVLPDLSANILCGNSLIASDFLEGELPTEETIVEMKKLNVFDWNVRFGKIVDGGRFDVVIGNPPYVRQESLKETKSYFEKHYESFSGTADLYAYFMEKGLKLIRPGGRYSIIVSSSFLRATYAEALRETLLKHAALVRIVDFGGLAVFADAKDTYVCIPVLVKEKQPGQVEVSKVRTLETDRVMAEMGKTDFVAPLQQFTRKAWVLKSGQETKLFAKVMAAGMPLGEYVERRFFRGVTSGLNNAFVIDSATRARLIKDHKRSGELIHPVRGGEDVREYFIEQADTFLIFTRRGVNIDEYPAIKAHLERFRADLTPRKSDNDRRGRKPGTYRWYEIQDDVAYYEVFHKPKLVFPDICKHPRFCYDDSGIYLTNTAYVLGTGDKYLLGILNSRLFWFAISNISIPFGVRAGEFRYRLIYQYMEKVPVRKLNLQKPVEKTAHDKMVDLVNRRLALTPKLRAPKTDAERGTLQNAVTVTDRQIDALVYELYGLTEDEIRLVEAS